LGWLSRDKLSGEAAQLSGLVRCAKPTINSCTPAASISAKRWRIVSGLQSAPFPSYDLKDAFESIRDLGQCLLISIVDEQNVVEVR